MGEGLSDHLHSDAMQEIIKELKLEELPEYKNWSEIKLKRIFSQKNYFFYVRDKMGQEYALKCLTGKSYDYYHRCYHYQLQIDDRIKYISSSFFNVIEIPDSIIKFGCCPSGEHFYYLLPWQHNRSLAEILAGMPMTRVLKPALMVAHYLRAAENICLENQEQALHSAGHSLAAGQDWYRKIDKRYQQAHKSLRSGNFNFAACEHFAGFYQKHSHLLASRKICLTYQEFSLQDCYYQPDGSIRLPLIQNWCKADPWYSLRGIYHKIKPINEDFAVFLLDSCFEYQPPQAFFICTAIYAMVELLEKLALAGQQQTEDFNALKEQIRIIDRAFAKFTTSTPSWYKSVLANKRQTLIRS